MFINTNIAAMNSQRHVFNTNKALDKTIERLSSGLRINSGADDASGLAMAEKMAAQNAGLAVASQNAQDGQALYKIAEGALAQVSAMLTRMEELAVRATNGTLTSSDRQAVIDEMDELRDQINKISTTTEYNTLKVLNGSMAVDAYLNATTVNYQGSSRIVDKPGTLKNASTTFSIHQLAQAASIVGGAAANSATASGNLTINGIDIQIASGDSVASMAAKINAQNDSTNVVALVTDAGVMHLVTGVLDADASNIFQSATNTVGYALQGSAYKITLTGNASILGNLGLTAGSAVGVNASATINSVALQAVGGIGGGHIMKDITAGSLTEGLQIETDLYNGANGVILRNNAPLASLVLHRSSITDVFAIKTNVGDRLRLQIGANYDQGIYNGLDSVNTSQLGIGGSSLYGNLDDIELDTMDNANVSLKVIQKAIEDVTAVRSKIGATMNRLDYTIKTLSIQRENMTAAQSRIQDADISAEMTMFTKQQIMLQAGTAMLAQANSRPQAVLQLLQ